MSSAIEGTFQIKSWDEESYSEFDDGSKQSHAKITQIYSGGLEGEGKVNYLMAYRSNGTAVFVGFERVTGNINGKSGSFVLQHNGTFASGVAKSNFVVVPGSGEGDLIGITGQGEFASTENGQASYKFSIET